MNEIIRKNLKNVADEIRDLNEMRNYYSYFYENLSVDVKHTISDVEFRINQDLEDLAELVDAYRGR